jgi:hypothetical protein
MAPSSSPNADVGSPSGDRFVEKSNRFPGITLPVSLSDLNNSSRCRKDMRMAVYQCTLAVASLRISKNAFPVFLWSAKSNPALLNEATAAVMAANRIGSKLSALLLKTGEYFDTSRSLGELGETH